ncbi:MBL fold metallo-hydrolase [Antrihabitans cavernicola]|uniref:MBL fold metallo-hydrolase n=1 Tax=Antrihabitans cavernicola TaxID=2495913 RepID=A0A5A7SK67_9NOCA|nr:MBL fold metallo-hydrolase [Spelaeibacter cavernicola]KAA0024855.1 MBL fold metallo-hydrolase [Spelaeibacter cavernicola]
MEVHHLNCGTMSLGVVDHCLLVETADSLVLIDSGFGIDCVRAPDDILGFARHLMRPALDENETAIRQIERLGFAPTDVRHIVLTHLDLDHAGGIADFPWATVHVHGPEFRAAMKPSRSDRFRYRAQEWAHDPRWKLNESGGSERWFGFKSVRDLDGLPPEILVVPLYGHTRGHVGVAVDTGTGWLLHCGDAFLTELQFNPLLPGLFFADALYGAPDPKLAFARLSNLRRLIDLNNRHSDEVTVFSSHDRTAFNRLASR